MRALSTRSLGYYESLRLRNWFDDTTQEVLRTCTVPGMVVSVQYALTMATTRVVSTASHSLDGSDVKGHELPHANRQIGQSDWLPVLLKISGPLQPASWV